MRASVVASTLLALGVAGASPACAGGEPQAPPVSEPAAPLSCFERVEAQGSLRAGDRSGPQTGLPTTILTVGGHDLTAEVARSAKQRNIGLMLRDELAPDTGMLFVYADEQPRSFWMRNTCLPLTIAYIDSAGIIVSMADMLPLDESAVPSRLPARYALEMTQGWFARKGVSVGDRVVGLTARPR